MATKKTSKQLAEELEMMYAAANETNYMLAAKDMRITELTMRIDQLKDQLADAANCTSNADARCMELQSKLHSERVNFTVLKNEHDLFEKQFFQLSANSRSMLMSMVYGLDMVTAASTHHEKEVVVRHMKTVYEGLANKDITLKLEEPRPMRSVCS